MDSGALSSASQDGFCDRSLPDPRDANLIENGVLGYEAGPLRDCLRGEDSIPWIPVRPFDLGSDFCMRLSDCQSPKGAAVEECWQRWAGRCELAETSFGQQLVEAHHADHDFVVLSRNGGLGASRELRTCQRPPEERVTV